METQLHDYVHALCRAIRACRQLEGVLGLLQHAAEHIVGPSDDGKLPETPDALLASWEAVQRAVGLAESDALSRLFYQRCFQELGDILLTGMMSADGSLGTIHGSLAVRREPRPVPMLRPHPLGACCRLQLSPPTGCHNFLHSRGSSSSPAGLKLRPRRHCCPCWPCTWRPCNLWPCHGARAAGHW